MTFLPKNALIAGTINLGNYDNFRFEFGAEINTAEDYLGLVEFAASSLIGQFRGADPQTQETVRAYVARLCSVDEAQVPVLGQQMPNEAPAPEVAAPAPAPNPEPIPPAPAAKPGEEICEKCGCRVSKSQAKLSMLFQSKTLCKKCMEATA